MENSNNKIYKNAALAAAKCIDTLTSHGVTVLSISLDDGIVKITCAPCAYLSGMGFDAVQLVENGEARKCIVLGGCRIEWGGAYPMQYSEYQTPAYLRRRALI